MNNLQKSTAVAVLPGATAQVDGPVLLAAAGLPLAPSGAAPAWAWTGRVSPGMVLDAVQQLVDHALVERFEQALNAPASKLTATPVSAPSDTALPGGESRPTASQPLAAPAMQATPRAEVDALPRAMLTQLPPQIKAQPQQAQPQQALRVAPQPQKLEPQHQDAAPGPQPLLPQAGPVTLHAHQLMPQPQQVAPQPQQVLAQPQQLTPPHQQTLAQPQQLTPQPQQVMPQPQQVAPQPQEVLPQLQQLTPQPQQVLPQPQKTTPQTQQVLPQPQQVAPQPQQMLAQTQQVAPQPQQAAPQPQQALPQPQQVTSQPLQVLPQPQQVTPQPQQVLPLPQQAAPQPQQVLLQPRQVAPQPQPPAATLYPAVQPGPASGLLHHPQPTPLAVTPKAPVALRPALDGDTPDTLATNLPKVLPPQPLDEEEQLEHALEQPQPLQVLPPMPLVTPAPTLEAAPATDEAGLRERLIDTVQQLMVSEVRGAGAQVRMVLQESVLPGTTIVVQNVGAQLKVSFECTAQVSRNRLERSAPAFAQSLARRMGREVLVEVQDDTGDALPPVQARAEASEIAL